MTARTVLPMVAVSFWAAACGSANETPGGSSSGSGTVGGAALASGGTRPTTGGAVTSGANSGGRPNGGTAAGGVAPGGAANGGANEGGLSAVGGVAVGGGSAGGTASGGANRGGSSNGGLATDGGLSAKGGAANGGVGSGGKASGGRDGVGLGGKANGGAGNGGTAVGGATTTAGGSNGTGGASGTCPPGGWSAGDQTITMTYGGDQRRYEVHIPSSYTGTTPVPLLLVIHGAHNTPAMARSWSQMNTVSNQNGFIVVYPAGLDCWNAGGILPGCTAAADDIGFLKAVVSEVESKACVDPKRVYATGISNGAMMAQYLGCNAADIFAAVGGVAGPTGQCSPSRAISVFYVHGTEDKTVSYSSAQPNVTGWANRDGCSGTPVETYNQGSTRCVTYQGCRDGVEVVFCTVTGMGHCWPEDSSCGPGGGSSYGVTDFKASPMMWSFFDRHPLP